MRTLYTNFNICSRTWDNQRWNMYKKIFFVSFRLKSCFEWLTWGYKKNFFIKACGIRRDYIYWSRCWLVCWISGMRQTLFFLHDPLLVHCENQSGRNLRSRDQSRLCCENFLYNNISLFTSKVMSRKHDICLWINI